MDEQSNKLPAGLRLKSILCSLLPIVCITFALIVFGCACVAANSSDPTSRYLTGKVTAAILLAVLILAISIPALSIFVFRGEGISTSSLTPRLFSALPAAAALYLAYLIYINKEDTWQKWIPLCAILSAAFFILKIFNGFEIAKFICGLGTFTLATLIIASLYLDFTIELNSPYKLSVQFAAVGIILGTMADMRSILSRTGAGRFIYLKTVASTLSSLASGLIFTATLNGHSTLPESYLAYSALYLCYSISACAELFAQAAAKIKSFI